MTAPGEGHVRVVDAGRCDHSWPAELTLDGTCDRCGLEYAEWSDGWEPDTVAEAEGVK